MIILLYKNAISFESPSSEGDIILASFAVNIFCSEIDIVFFPRQVISEQFKYFKTVDQGSISKNTTVLHILVVELVSIFAHQL